MTSFKTEIIILLIASFCGATFLNAQQEKDTFTFKQISETTFRKAWKNNFNASVITKIDSIKKNNALQSIEETYNTAEKKLSEREACQSPNCLTSFQGYYPTLGLYLFCISDYSSENAVFVDAKTNKMASGYRRFFGTYGAMSKKGVWAGLNRQDADNFLQLEICKYSKNNVWSLFKFNFSKVDINSKEKQPLFWADKNTIYMATHKYENPSGKEVFEYYAIHFHY